jgi:predicted DNA-binding protein (UPF0251 family)
MPRPVKRRRVGWEPNITYFKPAGVRMMDLEEVCLNLEEFEAIRLSDFEKLSQKKASEKMQVSQPTFSRILESARRKIADFLVSGKAIRVEGGIYEVKRR